MIIGLAAASIVIPGLQILAPVAWFLGHTEREKIKAGEVAPSQLVEIGWVIGMGVTVLGVLGFLVAMMFFGLLF